MRQRAIQDFARAPRVTEAAVKQLLLTPVDEGGLHNPYYHDFLGTTKSIVMRPVDRTLELCWGGLSQNGWERYTVGAPLAAAAQTVVLKGQAARRDTFEFIPL